MFKNYFVITLRNLFRQRIYSVVNVVGLAIGLAGCLLIFGFVANEISFERCHANRNRIYRVQGYYEVSGSSLTMARAVPALAPALQAEMPEVELATRFRHHEEAEIRIDNEVFPDYTCIFASPEFLRIFTLPLAQGNPETVLDDPFSALITEETAIKHFGNESPIGKTFTLYDSLEYQIAGVLQDVPANTQIRCDFLLPYLSLERMGVDVNSWQEIGEDYVYVLLREDADPSRVDEKLPAMFASYLPEDEARCFKLSLFPLTQIYLHSNVSWELPPSGDVSYVYLFSIVAILLLLIASINFINLATARTIHRSKEVGIRKVLGAYRPQLMKQFLGESILITSIAMVLGLGLFEIGKPQLESFLGRGLAIDLTQNPLMPVAVILMVVIVGIFSGAYPALYLSRYKPVAVLKQGVTAKTSRSIVRKILVVFQFVIAVGLIFCTLTIYKQVRYCTSANLGFDKENVVLIEFETEGEGDRLVLLRDEIERSCPVSSASSMYRAPGSGTMAITWLHAANRPEEDPQVMQTRMVDHHYITTFGLDIIEGRDFSTEYGSDEGKAILINESAVEAFEFENPIGQKLLRRDQELEIVGVVKDHHDLPLKKHIMPTMFSIKPESYATIAVKLLPDNTQSALNSIQDAYQRIFPGEPFNYTFLEEVTRKNYADDLKLGVLFSVFALLAIFIACLGVFGLSSFTAEQRTREFGIRKVLGATVTGIIQLVSREFFILVAIGSVVAWPIAWYVSKQWLEEFPYRIVIGVDVFILSGAIALVIALLTVISQALKAATSNPVDSLRYE